MSRIYAQHEVLALLNGLNGWYTPHQLASLRTRGRVAIATNTTSNALKMLFSEGKIQRMESREYGTMYARLGGVE